nr:hypothetical protein [Tanacetum cinerariifolium]
MVRGDTGKKRPREQSEQWASNEMSFPSMQRCQLVNSPIILEAPIEGFQVRRIYVDGGSSSEVMYEHCFRNLRAETKAKLKESRTPLVGFSGEVNYPIGTINLSVTLGEPGRLRTVPMAFVVVKSHSPYNVILGRTSLRSLGARMEKARGPTLERRTILPQMQTSKPKDTISKGTEGSLGQTGKIWNHDSIMQPTPTSSRKNIQTDEKDEGEDKPLEKPPTSNPPEKVVIHEGYPDQTITIGGNLTDECRYGLIKMLRKHADAFAWTPADMTGIPRSIAEHELKTYPHIEPKDLYPLPEIDWKIKSLMGFKYKCFLDAYKGYHQIHMAKKYEEKTAFHTDEGIFCYTKIPFGLKNARTIYQWLVDTIFEGKMGRNLEAYVDDMVVKSITELEMIKDVKETLMTLKKSESRKNKGCNKQPSPSNLKQMQRVSGKLAALNRFLSKTAERALACLDTLKKYTNKKDFHWTTEAEEALQAMKKLIAELPTLTAPKKEEELMVYLSAANEAVSAVLLVERDGRQIPIHYVSRTLQGTEINYPPMEKLALALVHAARRLRRYFQGHTVKGVELEAYSIKYAPRSAIKGQVLVDLLANTMTGDNPTQEKTNGPDDPLAEGESREEQETTVTKAPENLKAEADVWKLYIDGASNEHGSGAGLILIDPEGAEYSYILRLNFANSNNDAKYKALLAGLRRATK